MTLSELFKKMAEITANECVNYCPKYRDSKYRCCDINYCYIARDYAKEKYSIDLKATGNKDLLFMSDSGCIVPPYLRPICTLHACTISYADISTIEGSKERTKEYFELQHYIFEELEKQGKQITWPQKH